MRWILILAVSVLMILPAAYAENVVIPLGWHDTGYDLAAGYRYSISLESHCIWGVGCAKAVVSAGPVKIQLDGTRLTVWINNDRAIDGDTGSEATTVYIVVDYGGSGTVVTDLGRVGFGIDRSYRIMAYTEKVCFAWNCQESRVSISRQRLPNPTPTQTVPQELQPIEDEGDRARQLLQNRAVLIAAGVGVVAIGTVLALAGRRKLFALVLLILAALTIPVAMAQSSRDVEAEKLMYDMQLDKSVAVVRWQNQYGTGWWVNKWFIVTAAHVTNYQNNVDVVVIKMPYRVSGHVVYIDRDNDIAIIRVDEPLPENAIKTLPLCKSVYKGQEIIVIGYPYELLLITGSLEEMSANPRAAFGEIRWIDYVRHLAEVGASTDAGNSGGPVIDRDKFCVVGIISRALIGRAATLYFATTVDVVKQALDRAGVPYEERMTDVVPDNFGRVAELPWYYKYRTMLIATGVGVALLVGVVIGMHAGGRRW